MSFIKRLDVNTLFRNNWLLNRIKSSRFVISRQKLFEIEEKSIRYMNKEQIDFQKIIEKEKMEKQNWSSIITHIPLCAGTFSNNQ